MRLIDADETIREIVWNSLSESSAAIEATAKAIHCIENMPSIDAVPVVRCKDCKHYDSHDHRCKVWNHGINVEDFCSRGERKE